MTSFWKRAFGNGVIAGVIGYLVSVVFLAVVNVAAGRSPFEIPALLGGNLFYGGASAGATAGPVLAFNGVYLLLYIMLGILLGLLAEEASRGPGRLYAATLIMVLVVMQLAGAAILVDWVFNGALPAGTIIIAGLLAVCAMVAFLYQTHPAFGRMIKRPQAHLQK